MSEYKGLDGSLAVGRCGGFSHGGHLFIYDTSIGLNTCVAHGLSLFEFGDGGGIIGAPETGWGMSLTEIDRSWTGMALHCTPDNGRPGFRIDYRTTMPGVLYTLDGTTFGWDWDVCGSAGTMRVLPDGETVSNQGIPLAGAQIFVAETRRGCVLFVISRPILSFESISWEHWRFTFDEPGVRIMIVPLLSESDVPTDQAAAELWTELVSQPVLYCSERFERSEKSIVVSSEYTGMDGLSPVIAPLPPAAAQAGNANGLQELPEHTVLMQTVLGPYAVTKLNKGKHTRTLNTGWMNAVIEPTRDPGEISDSLPDELAYAGDSSWNESSVMDIMLSWRIWGQRYKVLPENLRNDLKTRVPMPSAKAFHDALMDRIEPATGQRWKMDRSIFSFQHRPSTASYDIDWYTGLTLSGLRRACECGDAAIEKQARMLVEDAVNDREDMIAYYSIFNDWAIAAPWSDARGIFFNYDCAHNGLEGVLAEMHFRRWAGDEKTAAFMEYIAAKMAPVFVIRGLPGFENKEDDIYGTTSFYETRHGRGVSRKTRAPYNIAGDFPEFAALLKLHGPVDAIRQQYADFLADRVRYDDWLAFYVGQETADRIRNKAENDIEAHGKQEARSQAAVFYHVAPDIAARLWILDQDPDDVIGNYTESMPYIESILCLAGYILHFNEIR